MACRNVWVLAPDQPRHPFDDGHVGAESSIHLRELETDVAPTDDHQMFRQTVERQHRRIGEVWHLADARKIRHDGAAADVEKNTRRRQQLIADTNGVRRLEAGVPHEHTAAGHAVEPFLYPAARVAGDRIGPRLHARHVDTDRAVRNDAVVGAATGEMRGICAGDERLGRHATGVDAGAAEQLSLDDGDGHAGLRQPASQR